MDIKRICVFCGSSLGANPQYSQMAELLGHSLVSKKISLVYGGASVGIMGNIARAIMEKGGEVIGIITKDLAEKNVASKQLSDLKIVDSMHQRKALMMEFSDGFIALPGGFGTIEEFFEVLTWGQLGMHQKPCGILDVCNYYSKLMVFLDHAVEEHFLEQEHRSMILVDVNPEVLLKKFLLYQPPQFDKVKWVLQMNESRDSNKHNRDSDKIC